MFIFNNSERITSFFIGITVVITFLAWYNPGLQDLFMSYPYKTYHFGQWYRCVTHVLIHANMRHLLFNMYALYVFGSFVETRFAYGFGPKGAILYFLLYIGGAVSADVVHVFFHANNIYYRALGASAGVSAVILSYVLFAPFSKILIHGFIPVPSWLYAIGYMFLSYYMIGRGGGIGHLAHLVGSVYGMVFTLASHPELLFYYIELLKRYLGGN